MREPPRRTTPHINLHVRLQQSKDEQLIEPKQPAKPFARIAQISTHALATGLATISRATVRPRTLSRMSRTTACGVESTTLNLVPASRIELPLF